MNLDLDKWGSFRISDLFPILKNGKANQGMLSDGTECFYVGAKKNDNGVMLHCAYDEDLIQKGNCIIFICNGQGSVGYANYMDVDFIGTTDIVAGYNENLNQYNGLFIATVLCQERPKYSFGRKWKTHLKDTVIKMPQTLDGNPDWKYMEQYIKSLNYKPLTTMNKSENVLQLDIEHWKEFKVGDFFDIHPTKFIKGVSAGDCVDYGAPLVVNSAENNGIAGLCDILPTEEGNIITFSDTTDGNTFFYQPKPFIGFAHIQGMYPKTRKWSKEELLFLSTIMMFDSKGKYSYGRKMRRDIILEIKIKLPVDKTGNPDWQFMKNYIKSLPYGDRI